MVFSAHLRGGLWDHQQRWISFHKGQKSFHIFCLSVAIVVFRIHFGWFGIRCLAWQHPRKLLFEKSYHAKPRYRRGILEFWHWSLRQKRFASHFRLHFQRDYECCWRRNPNSFLLHLSFNGMCWNFGTSLGSSRLQRGTWCGLFDGSANLHGQQPCQLFHRTGISFRVHPRI